MVNGNENKFPLLNVEPSSNAKSTDTINGHPVYLQKIYGVTL